jgi:hypothetical protein
MTTEGGLVSAHYKPFLTNGLLTIWPRFIDGADYLEFRIEHPFDDMTTGTDNLAVPVSFSLPIIYQLAVVLGPEYSIPKDDWMLLKKEAMEYTAKALAYYSETESLFLRPGN